MDKKIKNILMTVALLGFLAGPAAASEVSVEFTAMSNHSNSGQIEGKVVSCSGKFNPQGTIVHIPGVSVSTKLPHDGTFTLLFVPEGTHNLVFERNGRTFRSLNTVEVRPSQKTLLGSVEICPDLDGDGYAVTADFNDRNASSYPGAREICDRIDNDGDGEVDEGCSYRKCPKGGKFCISNWNNSNPEFRGTVKTQSWNSETPEVTLFHTGRVKTDSQVP
ncbi:putative metal-binding motif-containing protein [Nitrospina sp. 32_T5]|uniref:putative metal-binding motif-containing protein n=1 Tax=unclassified Nitrospina TaxID=2638683 RepID=UPI003F9E5B93